VEPDKAADLVRKLRAKAASTTFPEEEKLLTAKADKLCRRYRIVERPPEPEPSRWVQVRESEYMAAHRWGRPGTTSSPGPEAQDHRRDAGYSDDGGLFYS
jgi:hypothetical protein